MANITLRNVDEAAFRKFKVRAVDEGITLGRAVTQALLEWANKQERKQKRSLLEFKPVRFGLESKNLSKDVDRIVYGV